MPTAASDTTTRPDETTALIETELVETELVENESETDASTEPTTPTLEADSSASVPVSGVVFAFLALALAQLTMLAISVVLFDIVAVRFMLVFLVGAPAVLYGVIAAWDGRQLLTLERIEAPTWIIGAIFPPAYLALRWHATHGHRAESPVIGTRLQRARESIGWGTAQLALTAAFAVIALAATVTAPGQQAEAASGVDGSSVAQQLTAEGIAAAVTAQWADAGLSGTVDCPEPEITAVGSLITCRAVVEGDPISFTIRVTGDAGVAATSTPWTLVSWAATPAE